MLSTGTCPFALLPSLQMRSYNCSREKNPLQPPVPCNEALGAAAASASPYLPAGQAGRGAALVHGRAEPWQSVLALPRAFPLGYSGSSALWPCSREADALAAYGRGRPLVISCSLANCRGFWCVTNKPSLQLQYLLCEYLERRKTSSMGQEEKQNTKRWNPSPAAQALTLPSVTGVCVIRFDPCCHLDRE